MGNPQSSTGTPSGSELARREGDWFIEPFRRPAHLVIVGAIHIAIPLHRLAKLMGYRVTVIDARAKFATRERFPDADELIVAWPDEAASKLKLDNSTYVVILTHDPKFDLPALRSVLGEDVGYIGAIGSRKTNENRFVALREEGFTEEQLSRVHGPGNPGGDHRGPVWGLWIINAWGSQALSPLDPGLRAFPESPCFLAVAAGGHGAPPARMVARQVVERPPARLRVAQL